MIIFDIKKIDQTITEKKNFYTNTKTFFFPYHMKIEEKSNSSFFRKDYIYIEWYYDQFNITYTFLFVFISLTEFVK